MTISTNPRITGIGPSSNMAVYFPASDNVVRNSANDITDDDEVTITSIVVPPNNGATRGTIWELWSLWEFTNSASVKTAILRRGGSSLGTLVSATTPSQSATTRFPIHYLDNNTLMLLNNSMQAGQGVASTLLVTNTSSGISTLGFQLDINTAWGAPNIVGEFIRLKAAKLIQINPT